MPRQQHYSPEETARLGREIYHRVVLPEIQPGDKGKVVAIDVKTEKWILDETATPAARRLRAQQPDAEVWIERVGFAAYHHLGGHARRPGS